MNLTKPDLGPLEDVAFDSLQLDPNNPRIAPKMAPGYADADKLFDPELQRALTTTVFEAYAAEDLEKTIISLGWAPVDPIIVWRHPDRPDRLVVVEGNTRTSILRRARVHLQHAQDRLAKVIAGGRFKPELVDELKQEVAQLEALVRDTAVIRVQCVQAKTATELKAKLPRLLGVRHVSGAKNWGPYATNVYISSLYEDMFRESHPKRAFALDEQLIKEAAQVFSLSPTVARRMIQAASAFEHFKFTFGEKVTEAGNTLLDEDQYYFDQILQSKHARTEFGFEKSDLHLSEEASAALFAWAFSKPRKKPGTANENVFKKAEDIRAWQSLSKYDADNSTNYAAQLDVENPDTAPTIKSLINQKGLHEEQATPLQTLVGLVTTFGELRAESLHAQSETMAPLLEQVRAQAEAFLGMIKGAESHGAAT